MALNLSGDDLSQVASRGLSLDDLERQIALYKQGFQKSKIIAAATKENGGVLSLSDADISRYARAYAKLSKGKQIMKFVPASGAASRMFKDLTTFTSTYFGVAHNFEHEFPAVETFLSNLRTFAFYDDLRNVMEKSGLDIDDYMSRGDYTAIINFLLQPQYLGYAGLPKALLKFHRYGNIERTPLEEHIVEGALYAKMSDDSVHLHFTVSPEHRALFRKKIADVKKYYESNLHIKLFVTFSEQRHYTDSMVVDEYNNPVRDDNGRLIFRPGGHGALIENLNDCRADVIFIKNIDNVVPDWMKHTTVIYKKVLAGMLLSLQAEAFDHLFALSHKPTAQQLSKCAAFLKEKFHIDMPDSFDSMTVSEQTNILKNFLNRPIRVCGMVKNQGEPGGGPFFTLNNNGIKSLQILEPGQVNHNDEEQEGIWNNGTHFNPVDIVCGTKDWRGRRFNLKNFVDPATGFIVKRPTGSSVYKNIELPGLWNGAMANWNTVFVEVPLATFNPVKSVNDLLRKEHLSQ